MKKDEEAVTTFPSHLHYVINADQGNNVRVYVLPSRFEQGHNFPFYFSSSTPDLHTHDGRGRLLRDAVAHLPTSRRPASCDHVNIVCIFEIGLQSPK